MKFDWWKTIQVHEKVPHVHVVQLCRICSDWTLNVEVNVEGVKWPGGTKLQGSDRECKYFPIAF